MRRNLPHGASIILCLLLACVGGCSKKQNSGASEATERPSAASNKAFSPKPAGVEHSDLKISGSLAEIADIFIHMGA